MEENYLSYIAYFIHNVSPTTSKYEYRDYFAKVLGDDLFAADGSKLKKTARHLYRAYVASVYSRMPAFRIAEKLSDKQIEEFVQSHEELEKKYKVYYDTIDKDLDDKSVDKKIKTLQLTAYKSVLSKIDPKNSPTRIREEARKGREQKKASKANTTAKKTAKTAARSPKKTAGKTAGKTVGAKKTSGAKKVAGKTCSEYTVKELKDLATAKGVAGRSKMDKAQLCAALKIKK